MCILRILHTLNSPYVAAKCLASSAVAFIARCLCEGGSLKGGRDTNSCVFGFFALRMTMDENPSGVFDYISIHYQQTSAEIDLGVPLYILASPIFVSGSALRAYSLEAFQSMMLLR